MTTIQKIDAIESDKARLEALITKGGDWVSDRHGCVEFDEYSDDLIQNLEKRVEKLQKELIKLYLNLTLAYA